MTEILNHHTGEWEPNPADNRRALALLEQWAQSEDEHDDEWWDELEREVNYVPLPPGEAARRFRVICYVSVLVFLLTLTILVGLTYVR